MRLTPGSWWIYEERSATGERSAIERWKLRAAYGRRGLDHELAAADMVAERTRSAAELAEHPRVRRLRLPYADYAESPRPECPGMVTAALAGIPAATLRDLVFEARRLSETSDDLRARRLRARRRRRLFP